MTGQLGWPLTIALLIIATVTAGGLGTAIVAFARYWIEAGEQADDLAETGQHPRQRPGEPDIDADEWRAEFAAMPHVPAHTPGRRTATAHTTQEERIMTPQEMRWEMQRRSWEIHMDNLIGNTAWRTRNATG